MSSLTDILTAAKNLVTAVNNASQTYLTVNGLHNSPNINSATVVSAVPGRIASVSVLAAGSAGTLYDSASTLITKYPIAVIPAAVGVFQINIPVIYGIVAAPGSGQTVTVCYS